MQASIYPRSNGCSFRLSFEVIIKETNTSHNRLRILGVDKLLSTRVKQIGNAFARLLHNYFGVIFSTFRKFFKTVIVISNVILYIFDPLDSKEVDLEFDFNHNLVDIEGYVQCHSCNCDLHENRNISLWN